MAGRKSSKTDLHHLPCWSICLQTDRTCMIGIKQRFNECCHSHCNSWRKHSTIWTKHFGWTKKEKNAKMLECGNSPIGILRQLDTMHDENTIVSTFLSCLKEKNFQNDHNQVGKLVNSSLKDLNGRNSQLKVFRKSFVSSANMRTGEVVWYH